MSPLLQLALLAASLGGVLLQVEAHFPKEHMSNRLGLPGIPEVHSGRLTLQVSQVVPAMQEVRMGDRLELECEAFGGPFPAIQWLRDGQPIGQGVDEAKSLSNLLSAEAINDLGGNVKVTSNLVPVDSMTAIGKVKSRLVIDCVLPVHRGMYSCAAVSGTDADVSPPATVYVVADGVRNLSAMLSACQRTGLASAAPPRITSFATFMMDVSGTDMTLPCAAEGSPRPAVFWRDNNNQLIATSGPGARRNRYKVLPNGSLMIFKVRWSDMGMFTCVAQSETGRDNATTFVYPLSPSK